MSLDRCIGARVQLNLGIAGGGHSLEIANGIEIGGGGDVEIHLK